jgi:hypothetical protein
MKQFYDAREIFDGLAMQENRKAARMLPLNTGNQLSTKQLETAIHGMRKDVVYAIENIPQPIITMPDPVRNWERGRSSWSKL